MDSETQRLFVISLIGLLLFFPVFNQVAATALENLRDADHKAQLDDFFKNWDDIPDDRKLEYWDGRNPPPEHWEGGEPPDDFRYGGGNNNGGGPGNNGNGGEDENESEEEEEEETYVYETAILWAFPNENQSINGFHQGNDNLRQRDYHYVNVTYHFEGFSGNADFTLLIGGQEEWNLQIGGDTPALAQDDDGSENFQDIGTAPLEVSYEYAPIGFPQNFNVTITGTYPVSRG